MTDYNTIHLVISTEETLPDMSQFTPEETYLILSIGVNCLLDTRRKMQELTNDDIRKQLYREMKEAIEKYEQKCIIEVNKIERDMIIEKETAEKMVTKITEMYESKIEQLQKYNEKLTEQVKTYELDSRFSVEEEVNKIRSVFDAKLQEKEKQVERLAHNYEKIHETLITQKNKTVLKGIEGEKKFRDYAMTFQDFKGFELIDKHTQGGEGDFHLHFEEFDILVDAKNYKNGVPSKEREKIKNDLLKNEHIHFAWLVSLNTAIDKFDRCPIMTEWINSEKCIIYINNLSHFEDPKRIIRVAWFYCNDLMKFIGNTEKEEWKEIKDRQCKMIERIKASRKQIRELNTTLGLFKKQIDMIDNELKDLLNCGSEEIFDSHYSLLDSWWQQNIEITNTEESIVSTDIWQIFKQENKELVKEFTITAEKFKEYIKSRVPLTHLLMRSGAKGAMDIKGVKIKKHKQQKGEGIEVEIKK
jgi:hypothetical protein